MIIINKSLIVRQYSITINDLLAFLMWSCSCILLWGKLSTTVTRPQKKTGVFVAWIKRGHRGEYAEESDGW